MTGHVDKATDHLDTTAVESRLERLRERLPAASAPWFATLTKLSAARAIQSSLAMSGIPVGMEAAIDAQDGQHDWANAPPAALLGARLAFGYLDQAAQDTGLDLGRQFTKSLHYLFASDETSNRPGRFRPGFRTSADPSRPAADADRVERQTAEALARCASATDIHPLIGAIRLHGDILRIRPFLTANGRVARALQTLIVARASTLPPSLVAADESLLRAGLLPADDPAAWEAACLAALDAQVGVVARRVDEFSRLYAAVADLILRHRINPRASVPVFEAALGVKLTNARYMRLARTETHSATRDFRALTEAELLKATGHKRGRVYGASAQVLALRAATRNPLVQAMR